MLTLRTVLSHAIPIETITLPNYFIGLSQRFSKSRNKLSYFYEAPREFFS